MPRLSLCMIVRDEERMLPGCLSSVKGIADEVVVVDTGSTDSTREIAVRHGARVYDRPWDDDFAAPRNLALSHATCDYVLQLDADERLAAGAGEALRRALRGRPFDIGFLRLHHASSPEAAAEDVVEGSARMGHPFVIPRLFRRDPGLRFKGRIHENVDDWAARSGTRRVLVGADIVHLGGAPEVRKARNKVERNLALLRRACAEEQDSIMPWGYLAMELFEAGSIAEALEAADEGWRLLDRQPAWRSVHLLAMARSRSALALGQPGKAVEACEAEVARSAPTTDGLFLLGVGREVLASVAGDAEREALLEAAAAAYRGALARSGIVEMVQLFDGAASFRSHSQLGGVLVRLGRLDEAEEAFAAALRGKPGFDEARIGQAEVSLERGRPVEALQRLEGLLPSDRPDAWTLAAAAAGALGGASDRGLLLQRAAERLPKGFVAPHRRERLRRLAEDQRGAAGDPAALLAALVERRALPVAAVGAQPDDGLLRAVAADFLARGQGDRLVPLLEPEAESACPGLPSRFREVLRDLGAEVVGEAETAAAAR